MDDKIIADVTQMTSNNSSVPEPISDMKYSKYLLTNGSDDEFNDDFDKNQYLNMQNEYLNEYRIEGFENTESKSTDLNKLFINIFLILFIITLLYILWDVPK
jgi:hypothetical protein